MVFGIGSVLGHLFLVCREAGSLFFVDFSFPLLLFWLDRTCLRNVYDFIRGGKMLESDEKRKGKMLEKRCLLDFDGGRGEK